MDEKYISTDGKVTPVEEMNSYHLLNAFQKNVGIFAVTEEVQAGINIKLLKVEILKRLTPKACE